MVFLFLGVVVSAFGFGLVSGQIAFKGTIEAGDIWRLIEWLTIGTVSYYMGKHVAEAGKNGKVENNTGVS